MKIYHTKWHLLATFFVLVLPIVILIFTSHLAHLEAETLISDVAASLLRMLIAYLIAAILGWFAAISLYRGKRSAIALPLFDVLQSFPTFAALPIAVSFFGQSDLIVIFFLVFAIIWPIIFTVIGSLKLIHHEWEEAAEIYGLRGFRFLFYFLLPVTVPSIVTGSIIGLGDGWEALIATEIIVAVQKGMGPFFSAFSHDATITLFGILGFLFIIFSINKLVWLPALNWSQRMFEE